MLLKKLSKNDQDNDDELLIQRYFMKDMVRDDVPYISKLSRIILIGLVPILELLYKNMEELSESQVQCHDNLNRNESSLSHEN